MRGTYRVAGPFPYPQFPSSVSPLGYHLPPGGRLKTSLIKKLLAAAAQEGPRVAQTHPCFSPLPRAEDLLLKRETAFKAAPETFLWGSGAAFLFLGKRNVPQKHGRPDVQSANRLRIRPPHEIIQGHVEIIRKGNQFRDRRLYLALFIKLVRAKFYPQHFSGLTLRLMPVHTDFPQADMKFCHEITSLLTCVENKRIIRINNT